MMLGTILLVVLILLLLGGVPNLGLHSYGWRPSGGAGLLLVIVIILILAGRL